MDINYTLALAPLSRRLSTSESTRSVLRRNGSMNIRGEMERLASPLSRSTWPLTPAIFFILQQARTLKRGLCRREKERLEEAHRFRSRKRFRNGRILTGYDNHSILRLLFNRRKRDFHRLNCKLYAVASNLRTKQYS
ncbi:hypothetical protein PUN28_015706 [Cardiocondyla obscurior]|uniref:Ribosomal protein S14 n=1 Tax=Cardiocondyla obscurior TaxID=286306 RepID=A0AAW2EXI7_9HYME